MGLNHRLDELGPVSRLLLDVRRQSSSNHSVLSFCDRICARIVAACQVMRDVQQLGQAADDVVDKVSAAIRN